MILSQLRDYLKERGQASLQDLALHFDADSGAVRGMLEHWIRKGKVTRRSAAATCGSSCTQCDPAAVEIYRWNDAKESTPPQPILRDFGCRK